MIDPTEHLGLVRSIAARFPTRSALLDDDDAVQVGCLGLIQAARSFCPGRGVFSSYAVPRIRGALLDETRRLAPLSRSAHKRGLTVGTSSLDSPIGGDGGEDDATTFAEILPDPNLPDPDAALVRAEAAEELRQARLRLPEREQCVLNLYYEGRHPMRAIALELGVSESRIAQIHAQALRRLRRAMATA